MHRSGTSALAGSLSELGIDFGKNIVEPSFDNPKGFFENEEIQNVNDSILEALDIKWDSPGNLETNWKLNPKEKKQKTKPRHIQNTQQQCHHHTPTWPPHGQLETTCDETGLTL